MSVYVDIAELKDALSLAGTTFIDQDAERAAVAASGIVDSICRRSFGLTENEAGESRYFVPDRPWFCKIDDLVELVSVAGDYDNDNDYEQTLTVGTHFRVGPLNAPALNMPYTWLETLNGATLPSTGGYVRIVGRFGWPEPPVEVVQATMILASRLVKRAREAPFAIVQNGEVASRIGRTDPEVSALLARFTTTPPVTSLQLG